MLYISYTPGGAVDAGLYMFPERLNVAPFSDSQDAFLSVSYIGENRRCQGKLGFRFVPRLCENSDIDACSSVGHLQASSDQR